MLKKEADRIKKLKKAELNGVSAKINLSSGIFLYSSVIVTVIALLLVLI